MFVRIIMFSPLPTKADGPVERQELVAKLEAASKLKKSGRARKTVCHNKGLAIDSWKFNEWDYGKDIELPCNARGLFIVDNTIVSRGYDKFFNVNEVAVTKVDSLRDNTNQEYNLTVKENGCILFISGLATGELLVCSKHSTGPRDDIERNHAVEGERQLIEQLQAHEKDPRELAMLLHELNVTAVCELCDDDFEEHVLEYSRNDAGLYLHGLNFNTTEFQTYPMDKVTAFAHEWGFRAVDLFNILGFDNLWLFLTEAAKTGTYNQREVEGFVVRTKSNGNDFFFKFKFEEPYLLYRQFREVTKKFILTRDMGSISIKKHPHITRRYLAFVRDLFLKEPQLEQEFVSGHGIIKVRKLFLAELGLDELSGMTLIKIDEEQAKAEPATETSYKYALVPVSVIGCGKTTTFQTLTHLFGWEDVQNDNVGAKKKGLFVSQILASLTKADVVMCDRNNHQFRERKQLMDDVLALKHNYLPSHVGIKFIAVNFVPEDQSIEEVRDITYTRVKQRGDRHQSIKIESNEREAKSIMNGFITRLQPLDPSHEPDSEFADVIQLRLGENSSLDNAKTICQHLRRIGVPVREVSDADFEQAFKKALEYTPTFTKFQPKPRLVSYFGVNVDRDPVVELLQKHIPADKTYQQLVSNDRVQSEFHVTLAHLSSVRGPDAKAIWKQLNTQFQTSAYKCPETRVPVGIFTNITITRIIVAENLLITLAVDVAELPRTNKHTHITVGTVKPSIRPHESNNVLSRVISKPPGIHTTKVGSVLVIDVNLTLENQQCFFHL